MIRSRPIIFLAGAAVSRLSPCPSPRAVAAVVPRPRRRRRPRAGLGNSRRLEEQPRLDSGHLERPYPLSLQGRCRHAERVLGHVRDEVAAVAGNRQTDRRRGLTTSKLATITRSDGTRQVTYNGHPLYLFVKDHKPGDVKGQGVSAFGAAWFALSPSGSQISATRPASTSGGSSAAAVPPATSQPCACREPSRRPRGGSVQRTPSLRASAPVDPMGPRRRTTQLLKGRCSMNKISQKRLVDRMIEAYVSWRDACLLSAGTHTSEWRRRSSAEGASSP